MNQTLCPQAASPTSEPLKQDWLDAPHWQRLLSKHGFRSPPHYMALSTKGIRRYLKRAGVSVNTFHEMTGFASIAQFITANPTLPLWAFFGQLVEMKQEHSV